MDFGKVSPDQLPFIDFTLPADGEFTQKVLNTSASRQPKIYVGCAKWGRKEWIGLIYPPKTKESVFLDEYVKHFNSIELNAIFYAMPRKEQVRAWHEKAKEASHEFKFCPKFTRSISHIRRLNNAEEETSKYLESIAEFGDTLGSCFLQLSDNFGPKNIEVLHRYLENLPNDLSVCVEVRHAEWFSDQQVRHSLFEMLHDQKRGTVITDASGRRDCIHMELTNPEAFIRFVGNGLHDTDFSRIDEWINRLADWVKNGLQTCYFFLHQHDEKDTPILADYTIRKINQKLGLSLALPQIIPAQKKLFDD